MDNKVVQTVAKAFAALGRRLPLQLPRRGRERRRNDEGRGETDDRAGGARQARRGGDGCLPVARGLLLRPRADARRGRSTPSASCWSAPRRQPVPGRTRCPPTRSSSTAKDETRARSPTSSPGRVRDVPVLVVPGADHFFHVARCSGHRRHVAGGARRSRRLTIRARAGRGTSARSMRARPLRPRGTRRRPRASGLRKSYGDARWSRASTSRSRRASASACSAPTAPARPRRCAAASGSRRPTPATIDAARPPGAAGRARGAHPRGRRAADGQPRPRLHGEREPARLRPLLRHRRRRWRARMPRLLEFAALATAADAASRRSPAA